MTGSMDHRGDINNESDNESTLSSIPDNFDQAPLEISPATVSNPESSIVRNSNPGNTAPVTRPGPSSSTQAPKRKSKQTKNVTPSSSTSAAAPSGSNQPKTRRSARISVLASPDAEPSTIALEQGSSSTNTEATSGKGKKRASVDEGQASSSKKQ
jgi:hypothetical protein